MTPRDVLIKARELIAKRGGWTQDEAARTRAGTPTLIQDPKACSFCMMGALARVMGDNYTSHIPNQSPIMHHILGAMNLPPQLNGRGTVMNFNDRRKTRKKDVLDVFDRAIALAS